MTENTTSGDAQERASPTEAVTSYHFVNNTLDVCRLLWQRIFRPNHDIDVGPNLPPPEE